ALYRSVNCGRALVALSLCRQRRSLPATKLKHVVPLDRLDQQLRRGPDQRRRAGPVEYPAASRSKSAVKFVILSPNCRNDPMWCILPCSYKALTGSAGVTFPLLAHTVESATLGSTMRIVACTMSPPLLRSATMRSARCVLYAETAILAHSVGEYFPDKSCRT